MKCFLVPTHRSRIRFNNLVHRHLSTTHGRQKLFQERVVHHPRHLWYSPVCGPWSAWSRLNSSKSVEAQLEHHNRRQEHLYQIALGIVLYHRQIAKVQHFHWEQPAGSLMFHQPGISELHQHTQSCHFDMCEVGQLTDPADQEGHGDYHHVPTTVQIPAWTKVRSSTSTPTNRGSNPGEWFCDP